MEQSSIFWAKKSQQEALKILETSIYGLSVAEIEKRKAIYGSNSLPSKKGDSLFIIFLRQFNSPLIFILLFASLVTYSIGEYNDAYIILFVLIFNAIVGTIQEGKAEHTLEALKHIVETKARVIRQHNEFSIPDTDLVPGDIIVLREGDKVPADAYLIEVRNLQVDESALTGESIPVFKDVNWKAEGESAKNIGDLKNIIYKGTAITSGGAHAVVISIGVQTEIGKIATRIVGIDTEIPLKKHIKYLSHAIIAAVGAISLFIFSIGLIQGYALRTMFTTVISLAVSVIPEGLPIVITLVLATGVWRMSKKNALVKKLQAVEALGQAKVIAVDKTGTITKNELVVREVYTADQLFEVTGDGYVPEGQIIQGSDPYDIKKCPTLPLLAHMSALWSGADLSYSTEKKLWMIAGDPTEAAIKVFGRKLGYDKESLLSFSPLLYEAPFDYTLKYRSVLYAIEGVPTMIIAGAPEIILSLSTKTFSTNGDDIRGIPESSLDGLYHKAETLTEDDRKRYDEQLNSLSAKGQRVVAIAVKRASDLSVNQHEVSDMVFLGFIAMKDVLREEVRPAIEEAQNAGIKVVMITGDFSLTAVSIAEEAGIYKNGDTVMTGVEIESMTDEELSASIRKVTVFARVTPEHKLRIISAYQENGSIVAMTGDGVNDAPSLVMADLGIAMGITGTEVAKEAGDIVLLDDNFKSIVSAVEEGRNMYHTIKKVILYLFSTSLGEVLTIIVALLIGLPLPLLAAQIIWLNFITDGFLDVSLAMEPKEKGLLKGGFETPSKYIVTRSMVMRMVSMAIPMMVGTLIIFTSALDESLEKGWSMSLTVLAVFQWFNAWNCRSETRSIGQMSPFSNIYLVMATLLVIGLHMIALYTPLGQDLLRTVPLRFEDWLLIIPIACSIIVVEEIRKMFARRALHY